jgi:urea transporter
MADLMTTDDDRWWKQTLDGTARAYGRVVLCDNPFTGLMISLAMLFGSPVAWIVSLYCAALVSDDDGMGALITCVETCFITPKSLRSSPHKYVCLFINDSITTTPHRPTSPQRSSV